jgi:hypothetical protein
MQMSLARLEAAGGGRGTLFPDGEVVELTLLLPPGQAAALETAARQRGLTTAQLARQLVRDFLARLGKPHFRE